MKISLELDVGFYEEEAIEIRAKQWRKEKIRDLCDEYGFPKANVNSDGCELLLKHAVRQSFLETPWGLLQGLYSEMKGIEAQIHSGAEYEQIEEELIRENRA